jgi:hypothetical protein
VASDWPDGALSGKANVAEDNAVRVIDVFVDELDLGKLGFQGVDPLATGRPAYHPSVLLTQVADMLDDWQALRERIVPEDEARLREG